MTLTSDNAIVLQRWDFSETSQTVFLFTRENGLSRGLAKGAKRPKSKFSGGFDVLTRGQIVLILKPGKDLATLTEWHLERVYERPRHSKNANRVSYHMVDLVRLMFDQGDAHPRFYDHWSQILDDLESGGQPDLMLLRFQLSLLRETGYQPRLECDVETGEQLELLPGKTVAFAPRSGGIVADTGAHDRWRVRAETVSLLRTVLRDDAAEALELDTPSLKRSTRLLSWYIREILGREPVTLTRTFPDLG